MNASRDSSDLDWTLIARYLGGEMPPAERVGFEQWIAEEPGRREEIMLLRRLWNDAANIPTPAAVDAMWRSLAQRMTVPHADPMQPSLSDARRTPTRRTRPTLATLDPVWQRWMRPGLLAAAVVIFAAVMFVDHRAETAVEPVARPVKQFSTAPGQRATIQLSDGSRVELGIASVLRVEPFTDSSRVVTLEGEAMFDVVHDERRPFRVLSRGAVTEDLGTRFGIRAYREDRDVRVFVTSGLVRVRGVTPDAPPRLLEPGDLARIDPRGVVRTETNVDTTRYMAWTSSRVILRQERLRDAATEFGRWHDVAITVPDSRLADLRITVDMRLGTLEESLNAVTIPLGLRYELTEQGATILR
jgi:transmembrane sensor